MESQFLTIAIAHLLAVVSPGPDFILISRQTIKYGRKVSIYTSLGIAVGILFHISYCVIGIEILLEQNYFTNILTILCGSYLLYLGLSSFLISNKQVYDVQDNVSKISITNLKAFMLGFFTNILNIKATLFFLSLYSFLGYETDIKTKWFYGIWMTIITGLWFILLSIFMTNKILSKTHNKYYILMNKMMGIILIYIAIKIYLNY